MASFTIEINTSQPIPVISVFGEIDLHTCPQLQDSLNSVLDEGYKVIVADLSEVPYIDSTGLGVIAHAARRLIESQGEVRIVSTNSTVLKVIQLSGLTRKNIRVFDLANTALSEVH